MSFHIKDDFKTGAPVSQVPAGWFNAVAKFLNGLIGGFGIKTKKNESGTSTISLNEEALKAEIENAVTSFVTLDTTQTIVGAKTFKDKVYVNSSTDIERIRLSGGNNNGGIEIFGSNPYIDFHADGDTASDFTSRIIASGNGTVKYSGTAFLIGYDITDTSAMTGDASRHVATMGWTNKYFLRPSSSSSGFIYNTAGTISYKAFGTTSGTVAEGNHSHSTSDITDWATATADFLTSSDLSDYVTRSSLATTLQGFASSSHNHDTRYAGVSHAHGYITSDGKLSNCTSSDCLVVTTTGGVITHSNSRPKASDVAALVTQWISNSRKIGKASISTSDITDWSTATAGFLTSSNISITTSKITDWSTATAGFLTSSSLSGYVTSSDLSTALADYADVDTVGDLADVVEDIAADYQDASDVSSAIQTALADYVSTSDLATTLEGYLTDADLGDVVYSVDNVAADANGNVTLNAVKSVDGHSPNADGAVSLGLTASQWVKTDSSGHLTTTSDKVVTIGANQQGLTENVTVVIGAEWDGTQLIFYRKQLIFTNGVLTGTSTKTNLTISTVAYSP